MHRLRFVSLLLIVLFLVAACQPVQTPAAPTAAVPALAAPTVAVPTDVPPATPTALAQVTEPTATAVAPVETDADLAAKIESRIKGLAAAGYVSGAVLVARDGNVILDKAYGLADRENNVLNTATTRFRLGELTRQFTALAILKLQDQSKLKVGDLVCQYVADCPASWKGMSIEHLLTGFSGLADLPQYTYTGEATPTPTTPAELVEQLKKLDLKYSPGGHYENDSSGFIVAGYIVEQVSGQTYGQFMQEQIFQPLGMTNTGYANAGSGLAVGYLYPSAPTRADRLDDSLTFANAGLFSTADDLYRYSQALEAGQLLSPVSLKLFSNWHAQADCTCVFSETYQDPGGYGYGWIVAHYNGHSEIGHADQNSVAGYGADFRRFPDENTTVILLMNQSSTGTEDVLSLILPLIVKAK